MSEHQQGYDIKDVCQDGLKVASRQKQCTEYKMYYYIYIFFKGVGFKEKLVNIAHNSTLCYYLLSRDRETNAMHDQPWRIPRFQLSRLDISELQIEPFHVRPD